MILKIVIVVVLLLAGFLLFVATRPSSFSIKRSVTIAAPAPAIFPRLNDLHQVHEWAPWKDKDPNCSYTFEGPPAGIGASQSWTGNNDVGAGKQTIIESRANEVVRMKLEFYKPFEGLCESTLALAPDGSGTRVTWKMTGANNFIGKVFCLFMNQDKMIGNEFEKGLATLKRLTEAAPRSTN